MNKLQTMEAEEILNALPISKIREMARILNFSESKMKSPFAGTYVVVRTYSAGVHAGVLKDSHQRECILVDSRRIWQWSGAFTLSAVATKGIKDGKVSCVVPEIYLSEAIEIIPCSKEAEKNIREFKEHAP